MFNLLTQSKPRIKIKISLYGYTPIISKFEFVFFITFPKGLFILLACLRIQLMDL